MYALEIGDERVPRERGSKGFSSRAVEQIERKIDVLDRSISTQSCRDGNTVLRPEHVGLQSTFDTIAGGRVHAYCAYVCVCVCVCVCMCVSVNKPLLCVCAWQ